MPKVMDGKMIAACGMNCYLCLAYQKKKNHCEGCRAVDEAIRGGCLKCIIRGCPEISTKKLDFCFECDKYPCRRLVMLDKRYKSKYYMSMLENLEAVKAGGLDAFIQSEHNRWMCLSCGSTLCVHRKICPSCGVIDNRRPSLRI